MASRPLKDALVDCVKEMEAPAKDEQGHPLIWAYPSPKGRVDSWWSRKSPAFRTLALCGSFASVVLFVLGIYFDYRGKAFSDAHPFLVSVPKDLFRLALLGILGILLIDGLKTWARSWSGLWSLAPALLDGAQRFVGEMGRCLGFGPLFGMASNLGYMRDDCYDLFTRLNRFVLCLKEYTFPEGAPSVISTQDVREAWETIVLEEPPSKPPVDFERMSSNLLASLGELRSYTSPGTGAAIGRCMIYVADMREALPRAQNALRSLFGEPQSLTQLDWTYFRADIQPCLSALYSLCIVLQRVKYESERGREYPGRREREL